jgi:branched-chain amino acid transport system ATP-binding protein
VQAGYNLIPVVRGASLNVNAHELVAIIGPNGAGKSTLLKGLIGASKLFGGEIIYTGHQIAGLSTDAIARHGIGYVPQGSNVFPSLTVWENLRMGAYCSPRTARQRAVQVLATLPELRDKMKRRAGVLSGGERTMLGIGRALMAEPGLLLLDEPSSGLAPKVVAQLWEHLTSIMARGIAMIVVEQRAAEILEIAQRGYVLVDGRCVTSETSSRLKDMDLASIFLGGSGAEPVGRPLHE